MATPLNRTILTGLLIATLPLAAACGGGTSAQAQKPAAPAAAQASGSAQQVTIKGVDTMKFEPASITVKAGQPVTLTFENGGAIVHDVTLMQGQGVTQKVQAVAQGKGNATATFTIAQPGTYTFICAQPGHEAAGMKGTIVAQ